MSMDGCCPLHIDGPAGACCDPDDCGPCCNDCPTCPSMHTSTSSGRAYSRRRGERGSAGGALSSIVLVLALIVACRLVFHTDPIMWLDVAADWCVALIRDIAREVGS